MQEITVDNLNDRDKVIRTLANVKANCYVRVQSGECDSCECPDCYKYQTFNECLDQMSNFDRLQIDCLFENEINRMASHSPRSYSHISTKPKTRIGTIIGYLIIASSLSGIFSFLFKGIK